MIIFLSIIYILWWHYSRDDGFSTIIDEYIRKSFTYDEK